MDNFEADLCAHLQSILSILKSLPSLSTKQEDLRAAVALYLSEDLSAQSSGGLEPVSFSASTWMIILQPVRVLLLNLRERIQVNALLLSVPFFCKAPRLQNLLAALLLQGLQNSRGQPLYKVCYVTSLQI
jgi:hypothetical protein